MGQQQKKPLVSSVQRRVCAESSRCREARRKGADVLEGEVHRLAGGPRGAEAVGGRVDLLFAEDAMVDFVDCVETVDGGVDIFEDQLQRHFRAKNFTTNFIKCRKAILHRFLGFYGFKIKYR